MKTEELSNKQTRIKLINSPRCQGRHSKGLQGPNWLKLTLCGQCSDSSLSTIRGANEYVNRAPLTYQRLPLICVHTILLLERFTGWKNSICGPNCAWVIRPQATLMAHAGRLSQRSQIGKHSVGPSACAAPENLRFWVFQGEN